VKFAAVGGLSGSLTQLSNGTSYLVAGSGVTISSGSTGQVTIAASPTDFYRMGVDLTPSPNGVTTTFSPSTGDSFKHVVGQVVIAVYLNGVRQRYGVSNDFTVTAVGTTGTSITFNDPPISTDAMQVDYIKV
jgi:hypothetical protein